MDLHVVNWTWPAKVVIVAFFALTCLSQGEVVQGPCFGDAIPAGQRRELLQGGESYPLGLWSGNWEAGYLTTHLVRILIQERLGFNASVTGEGGTLSAFHALAGCLQPSNLSNRGCGPTVTYSHIHVENWAEGYLEQWKEFQSKYPSMAPVNVGGMGYTGHSSLFLARNLLETAYYEDGTRLDFYRGWNSTWSQPWRYFDSVAAIDKSSLLPCAETQFQLTGLNEVYLGLTGDTRGVKRLANGDLVAVCPDGYFWLSPSCRTDASTCVPLLTGGTGWATDEMMQKATAYDMTLAVGVARVYSELPRQVRALFFWWVPDPTFLSMEPVPMTFPRHDADAFLFGDKRTQSADIRITKLVSQDLSALAPPAAQLVENLWLSMDGVNQMLLDKTRTGDEHEQVACRWLQSNQALWRRWLPDKTKCFPGFGLYHIVALEFALSREDPNSLELLECRTCSPGMFSSRIDDSSGITYGCSPCPVGSMQPSAAAISCEPCPRGTFAAEAGRVECQLCRLGTFQDDLGSSECKACPNGTTTLALGSPRLAACGCEEGTIELERSGSNITCSPCPLGLSCPVLASVTAFTGSSTSGAELPKLLKGFWSPELDPLLIYKCAAEEHCPGGLPGSCAGGREDLACATCPAGMHWQDGQCVQCEDWLRAAWGMAILTVFLSLLLAGRRWKGSSASVERELSYAAWEVVGLVVQGLQTFALIRTITVPWPTSSLDVLLSALILKVDELGFQCVAGQSVLRLYLVRAGFVPTACAWIFLSCAATRLFARRDPARPSVLVAGTNACGGLLMTFYEGVSNLALAPFMCYEHPNGERSILHYANMFCGSVDHTFMVIMGCGLGLGLIAFLAFCVWAVQMLPHWSSQRLARVAAFRFLFGSYRLDAWWYGVPTLVIGPLLALPKVVATDSPVVQVALLTAFVFIHLLFLLLTWPWKVPLVNLLAAVGLTGAIFSILSASFFIPDPASEMSFSANFASLVRFLVLLAFGLSAVAIGFGLAWSRWTEGQPRSYWWLHLGQFSSPRRIVQVLRSTAHGITMADVEVLRNRVTAMSTFDKHLLKSALNLLVMEVVPDTSLKLQLKVSDVDGRMRSSAFREGSSTQLADGAAEEEEEDSCGRRASKSEAALQGQEFNKELVEHTRFSEEESTTPRTGESDHVVRQMGSQPLGDCFSQATVSVVL